MFTKYGETDSRSADRRVDLRLGLRMDFSVMSHS